MMEKREFDIDKEKNFSEWYNTIIYAADLADNRYNVKGFIVHKPRAMFILNKIYAFFESELKKDAHEQVLFPTVIPEENLEKEKEHLEGFIPEVFWITEAGSEKLERKLFLRPTSETAFYKMYSLWLREESQLPFKFFQSCSVFRNEKEPAPFLRGKEFLWIETHDVFASSEEAVKQVKKDMEITEKIFKNKLQIPFLVFQRPYWDTFPGAEKTFAYDILMPDGKVLQIATTHLLGQNFSKPFNIKYRSKKGEAKYVYQTCFGPGVWRILAAIVSIHGDKKGLILPSSVASLKVIIIPIFKEKNKKEVLSRCAKTEKLLEKESISAKVDSSEKTPGFKFNKWEMLGVPIRIEIGEKEVAQKEMTVVFRDNKEKIRVKEEEIVGAIKRELNSFDLRLKKRAEKYFSEHIIEAHSLEEVEKILDNKGIAKVPFCSIEKEGEKCAAELQEKTRAKVRGIIADTNTSSTNLTKIEKTNEKCIICGKPARYKVYVARQY